MEAKPKKRALEIFDCCFAIYKKCFNFVSYYTLLMRKIEPLTLALHYVLWLSFAEK